MWVKSYLEVFILVDFLKEVKLRLKMVSKNDENFSVKKIIFIQTKHKKSIFEINNIQKIFFKHLKENIY